MNEQVFQDVFDKLQDVLPAGWKKVIFYAGYTDGSYSMKFYTDCGDGIFTDCFSFKEVGKAQLIKLFMDIDKVLGQERKELEQKSRWSVMTMIVDANGSMKTEFDYTDISENAIAYEQEWKKRYL